VVAVIDGDTVTISLKERTQLKVRLAGIDAPEQRQVFGQRAKQRLATLLVGKTVEVAGRKYDRYHRLVARLLVDGRDINLEMVAEGYAWHFKRYEMEQSATARTAYADAERRAQMERRGLWADPAPVPPWEFRRLR
jgi:endonuclease YncB( thermonuclease family)